MSSLNRVRALLTNYLSLKTEPTGATQTKDCRALKRLKSNSNSGAATTTRTKHQQQKFSDLESISNDQYSASANSLVANVGETFDASTGNYLVATENYLKYPARVSSGRLSGGYQTSGSPVAPTSTQGGGGGGSSKTTMDAPHQRLSAILADGGDNSFTANPFLHQLRQQQSNTFDSGSFGARFALIMESLRNSMMNANPAHRVEHYHQMAALHPHLAQQNQQIQQRQQSAAALISSLSSPTTNQFPAHNLFGRALGAGGGQAAQSVYGQPEISFVSSRQGQRMEAAKLADCLFSSCNQTQNIVGIEPSSNRTSPS